MALKSVMHTTVPRLYYDCNTASRACGVFSGSSTVAGVEDETAHAELCRRIDLTTQADGFALGWKNAALLELDAMRREMPYADTLELRLICERRGD